MPSLTDQQIREKIEYQRSIIPHCAVCVHWHWKDYGEIADIGDCDVHDETTGEGYTCAQFDRKGPYEAQRQKLIELCTTEIPGHHVDKTGVVRTENPKTCRHTYADGNPCGQYTYKDGTCSEIVSATCLKCGANLLTRKNCPHKYPDGTTAWEGGFFGSMCNLCGENDL
jgi:hypothetical protein